MQLDGRRACYISQMHDKSEYLNNEFALNLLKENFSGVPFSCKAPINSKGMMSETLRIQDSCNLFQFIFESNAVT